MPSHCPSRGVVMRWWASNKSGADMPHQVLKRHAEGYISSTIIWGLGLPSLRSNKACRRRIWLSQCVLAGENDSSGHLGRFYLWWVWSASPCLFLITLGWKSILFDIRMATPLQLVSWDHFLGKLFSSLLLWGHSVFVTEVNFLYAAKCWVLFM